MFGKVFRKFFKWLKSLLFKQIPARETKHGTSTTRTRHPTFAVGSGSSPRPMQGAGQRSYHRSMQSSDPNRLIEEQNMVNNIQMVAQAAIDDAAKSALCGSSQVSTDHGHSHRSHDDCGSGHSYHSDSGSSHSSCDSGGSSSSFD
jgi:hypothetical protein